MDIVVTVPMDYNMEEKLEANHPYWRVRRWPKETEPGEHIYFAQHGEVRWRATISDTQWGQDNEMDFEHVEELDRPRMKMESFRGYRYYREDH